ncbi:hypothetical protein KEG38_15775 [Polyangium jinanense]|nr:hypothetical protein [Polyangium jinanense]
MEAVRAARHVGLLLAFLVTGCQRGGGEADSSRASASSAAPSASAAPVTEAPSPPVAPSTAAPSAVAPAPEPPFDPESVTAVIVWQKGDKAKGGFRSSWVERVADKPEVKGERPGILVVSSTSIWSLGTTIVKGCPQYAFDADGQVVVRNGQPVRVKPDLKMPELVRAEDGKRVAPWKDGHGYPTMGTQCESSLEEYGVHVQFEGGMGPFVVASVNTYANHGGAHGIRGQNFVTIDLDRGEAVELGPPEKDKAALVKAAAAGLSVEPKEVRPAGVVLMYGPLGAGLALYRFWAFAPYVGGLGGNSYSNDFVVSSKSLPAALERYQKLPAWVVPHLNGKSLVVFMVPPARKAVLRQHFDAAYSK